MRKIYLEKRSIIICSEDDSVMTDPNAIRFSIGDDCGLHEMIGLFEVSDTLQRIYIPTDNIESTYRKVCGEFLEVNAGGGLVENRRGDYLLINRNHLWDLPKGHQDPGEDISVTALREVQEETGLNIRSPQLCGIKDWCENQCRYVVLFYKAAHFEGELRSSSEGEVWWEDIANFPNLKLSLDMSDMLRVFMEEDLSEFFYYQEGSEWKYDLK